MVPGSSLVVDFEAMDAELREEEEAEGEVEVEGKEGDEEKADQPVMFCGDTLVCGLN